MWLKIRSFQRSRCTTRQTPRDRVAASIRRLRNLMARVLDHSCVLLLRKALRSANRAMEAISRVTGIAMPAARASSSAASVIADSFRGRPLSKSCSIDVRNLPRWRPSRCALPGSARPERHRQLPASAPLPPAFARWPAGPVRWTSDRALVRSAQRAGRLRCSRSVSTTPHRECWHRLRRAIRHVRRIRDGFGSIAHFAVKLSKNEARRRCLSDGTRRLHGGAPVHDSADNVLCLESGPEHSAWVDGLDGARLCIRGALEYHHGTPLTAGMTTLEAAISGAAVSSAPRKSCAFVARMTASHGATWAESVQVRIANTCAEFLRSRPVRSCRSRMVLASANEKHIASALRQVPGHDTADSTCSDHVERGPACAVAWLEAIQFKSPVSGAARRCGQRRA